MLKKIKNFFSLAAIILGFSLTSTVAFAATPSASIVIDGSSYGPGADFSLPVDVNSNSNINVVSVELAYDQSQLKFLNIDNSTSAFGGGLKATGGNGKIDVIRYVLPQAGPISGNNRVFVINFEALANTASANVSLTSNNMVLDSTSHSNIWDGNKDFAMFSFVSPGPTPVPVDPIPNPTPKPIQALPKTQSSLAQPKPTLYEPMALTKAYSISTIPYSSVPLDTEPTSALVNILVAAGLAMLAAVAMYFDAHVRLITYSGQRFSHKKMLINSKLRVKLKWS